MSKKELKLQDVDFDFIEGVLNDLLILNRELIKLNEIIGGDSYVEEAMRATRLLEDGLDCVLDDECIKIPDMRGDDE